MFLFQQGRRCPRMTLTTCAATLTWALSRGPSMRPRPAPPPREPPLPFLCVHLHARCGPPLCNHTLCVFIYIYFLVCSFTRQMWTSTVQPHTVCVHLHVGSVPVPALCERCGAASADVGWGVGRTTQRGKEGPLHGAKTLACCLYL